MVFNKTDRAAPELVRHFLELHHPAVAVSAKTGEGIEGLLEAISRELRPIREFLELSVPYEAYDVIARLHSVGQVLHRDYNGATAKFHARIPPHHHAEFEPFVVRDLKEAS